MMTVSEQERDDHALAQWLASQTGDAVDEVERELELGGHRRMFVVDELIEAGYVDGALLDLTMRLTGLDESSATSLIANRQAASSGG
jgi:hypothetical protein